MQDKLKKIIEEIEEEVYGESESHNAEAESIRDQLGSIAEIIDDLNMDIEVLNDSMSKQESNIIDVANNTASELKTLKKSISQLKTDLTSIIDGIEVKIYSQFVDHEDLISSTLKKINLCIDGQTAIKAQLSSISSKPEIKGVDISHIELKLKTLEEKLNEKDLVKNVVMAGGVDRLADLRDVNLDGLQKDSQGRYILGSGSGGSSEYESGGVTRVNGYITSVTNGDTTTDITRTIGYVSSFTDGTQTVTINRDSSNYINTWDVV